MSGNLDRVADGALRQNIPLSALFELTGRCNLDCGHCYLDIHHPPDEMSTAEALHVVDELKRAGTLFLTLTGGEIFLRKDVLIIAAHAKKLGMAIRMFTNATRITRELAREIARIKPLAVEISIYGTHAAVHDGVTARRRTLRRTLRGALLLKRAGVNVGLKAPLLGPVIDEIDELLEMADRIGAPMKFDPFVTPRHDYAGNQPLLLRSDTASLAVAMSHPRLLLFEHGVSLPAPLRPDDIPCALARRSTKISPTGDVYPCPTYPQSVGNVLQKSFGELWAGGELLDRLRAVRARDLQGDCHECGQSGYCGRCTAVALLEHGNEMGPAHEACRVATAKEMALGAVRRQPTRPELVRLRVLRG
jgi:radical SAM protein with 4Fe4S-binding SPASM domain